MLLKGVYSLLPPVGVAEGLLHVFEEKVDSLEGLPEGVAEAVLLTDDVEGPVQVEANGALVAGVLEDLLDVEEKAEFDS